MWVKIVMIIRVLAQYAVTKIMDIYMRHLNIHYPSQQNIKQSDNP